MQLLVQPLSSKQLDHKYIKMLANSPSSSFIEADFIHRKKLTDSYMVIFQ
jgi:hypothetical protein